MQGFCRSTWCVSCKLLRSPELDKLHSFVVSKRDAQDRLFRMLIYSFSFRDELVGFSRNPRLIRALTYPTTFACRFSRLQLTRFVSLTLALFQQQLSQSENRRSKINAHQTTTGFDVTCHNSGDRRSLHDTHHVLRQNPCIGSYGSNVLIRSSKLI